MKGLWNNLVGIYGLGLQFGKAGLRIISSGTRFLFRNAADSADVPIRVSRLDVSGDDIVLGSEDTEKLTLSRDGAMADPLIIILPTEKPTDGSILTSAAGEDPGTVRLVFTEPSGTSSNVICDETEFAFGSTGTLAMFTLPAGATIDRVVVIPDEPFDGTPTISIGITGELSKYVPSTAVDLLAVDVGFEVHPFLPPPVAPEDLIATYSAGGSTEGEGRILVYYTPAAV